MQPSEKIAELQKIMARIQIDAWIVPSADPHQSEYPADHWKTRAWLSGFIGSAGTVVVTQQKAGLWVDPRYHIRAEQELQGSGIQVFKMGHPGVPGYVEWLSQELKTDARIGFDGSIFSAAEMAKINRIFAERSVTFVYQNDLVAQIWQDRPGIPGNPVWLYPLEFAGESRASKLKRIRAKLSQQKAQAVLISGLDEIAWTLNIRGSDVQYNPVAISYLVVMEHAAHLFIHSEKVTPGLHEALQADGISFSDYDDITSFLEKLSRDMTVLIDPEKTSYKHELTLSKTCRVKYFPSIPGELKAIKNEVETKGLHEAHVRDGVAMVRWLFWLDQSSWNFHQTEITLADKLTAFRQLGENYQGLSFGTICGYRANSAVGHYSSDPATTPTIQKQGILLLDSGAQYLDGTTDITRTFTLSEPNEEEKNIFTLVLKCHIRLARAIFPKGTTGSQLDAIAREYLWQQGWNCRHGIGHGVGHFLNVHEGPQRFSPENGVALEPGMVISNEPGVYFEGKFGVRLENLLVTVKKENTVFGEFFGFETVGYCPFDIDLLEETLLTGEEKTWLNHYHKGVFEKLSPFLSDSEREWLQYETRMV